MARKNLLGALMEPKLPAGNSERVEAQPQEILCPRSSRRAPSARSAVHRAAEESGCEAQRIQDQLAAGQTIVELDPSEIDGAIIKDRLSVTSDAQNELQQSIAEQGQQVPILVRPHPRRQDVIR